MSSTLLSRATVRTHAIPVLPLRRGGVLTDIEIASECFGDPDAPAVLVLGGISAGRHLLPTPDDAAPGWWPGVVGSGAALDPAHYRLVGIDWLAGRGASSGPAADARWPALDTADQAAAILSLLDGLDIGTLHAVVGASYGGMVALALAALEPARVERVVAIAAAHRAHPLATAVRSVQRRILRLGIERGAAADAVAIARALAMSTYRTRGELRDRFTGEPEVGDVARFPVDAWLDVHGDRYAASFPAESLHALSQSLDLHDIDPSAITARCTLAPVDSDTLVPPEDVHALARALGERATVARITSHFGHDGFLQEAERVGDIVAAALRDSTCAEPRPAGAPPACVDGEPVTHYAARASAASIALQPATRAVRGGLCSDAHHGAVTPPIQLSSTFGFAAFGESRHYDYTRSGNPTRDLLGQTIAELEGGAAGIVTATGMAAIGVVLNLAGPGDLVVAPHDGYGGTYRLLRALARRQSFDLLLLDLTDPASCDVIRSRAPRLVWVETPSNPLLRVTDIAAVARAAHDAGALSIVDNTFLSPALQSPLALGADVVVHSTTKYITGHSDVVGGAIAVADAALAEEIGWWANCTGATGSPFDSWLALRGVRTLHPRMRAHEENTALVTDLLASHPAVRAVHYPGLPSHPQHALAARQQRGFGGMCSFELHGGEAAARRFVEGLRCFTLAESLGGVESLVAHPATMTHAAMDRAARHTAGITDGLLRLSVGIEAAEDLLADISLALGAAGGFVDAGR